MKKTKTIEVEICDQCGVEIESHPSRRHLKQCASCEKEFCPNCEMRFEVTIQQITPHRQEYNGLYSSSMRTSPPYETGFSAAYCSQCGHQIEANLLAFGLKKLPIKKPRTSFVKD